MADQALSSSPMTEALGDLIGMVEPAIKWMRWWIEQEECECENGHSCGLDKRFAECVAAEGALLAIRDKRDEWLAIERDAKAWRDRKTAIEASRAAEHERRDNTGRAGR